MKPTMVAGSLGTDPVIDKNILPSDRKGAYKAGLASAARPHDLTKFELLETPSVRLGGADERIRPCRNLLSTVLERALEAHSFSICPELRQTIDRAATGLSGAAPAETWLKKKKRLVHIIALSMLGFAGRSLVQ
jgi:hypothetical protein